LTDLLHQAFGHPPGDMAEALESAHDTTLIVMLDDRPVGTLRTSREGDRADIYGFAVDPGSQGRGIGRDVLRRVCRQLRRDGAQRVQLEVAVHNDRALGLYLSLGFTLVQTEDYFALALPD
jgi:ribosomal protein S18 acetylase RimI-like enzyme